ncbi:unnamed protein product [Effrenium voratum]|uniref:Leucine-rich repeat domain-containing protein n=1 Tax=Effrenium voratum TaxID=2562239 RepID=A0AA36JDB5_9DINO|nr:unnamed protein product [Effrenium voratum]
MAKEITVRQLSGEEESFQVFPDMTVGEFKRQRRGWLRCADESMRNMSSVELVLGDRPLLNNKELVSNAIPGAEVLAFLSIKPVTCSSLETSGVKPEDLRVVEIPESMAEIGERAFLDCSSLADVTIPNSVTVIRENAFQSCSSLATVTIPSSVTQISRSAFQGCRSLVNVTIPDSVTEIAGNAFRGCSSLANVTIPNSVTVIGDSAFGGCSLAGVTIPNSVTRIAG